MSEEAEAFPSLPSTTVLPRSQPSAPPRPKGSPLDQEHISFACERQLMVPHESTSSKSVKRDDERSLAAELLALSGDPQQRLLADAIELVQVSPGQIVTTGAVQALAYAIGEVRPVTATYRALAAVLSQELVPRPFEFDKLAWEAYGASSRNFYRTRKWLNAFKATFAVTKEGPRHEVPLNPPPRAETNPPGAPYKRSAPLGAGTPDGGRKAPRSTRTPSLQPPLLQRSMLPLPMGP